MYLFFTVLVFFCSHESSAEFKNWPEEARSYLQQLPQQTLTVEYVVARSLSDSDIFKLHKTEYLKGEALYMGRLSAEDFKLKGSYLYTDNRNQQLNPFSPQSIKGWEARLGFDQFFASGTTLNFEAFNSPKELTFSPGAGIGNLSFTETRYSLGVSQSLLGDFFGSSYRGLKRADQFAQEALELDALAKMETSTMDTIKLYYQAWLKQQNLKNLQESLARRNRLNKILKSQSRRGVIEVSDSLQVEGATLNNEVDYVNSKQELQSLWEKIVVQLSLPKTFLNVPADEIPILLDAPEGESLKFCKTLKFDDVRLNSIKVKQLSKAVESAKNKYEALKEKLMPDVRLQGNYIANAVNGNARQTWTDAGNLDNPQFSAGVSISFPLQNRQQKAQFMTAHIDYEQAKTNKSNTVNMLEVQWRELCSHLERKINNRELYKQVFQKNKQRVQLDNRRFELGRIKAFQWVQSEDDQAQAALRFQLAEVEVRELAWDVQRQTGHLIEKVSAQLGIKSIYE